jgi:hypothetical protein
MLDKLWLILFIAPECRSVFRSRTAPKIVAMISKLFSAPKIEYAAMLRGVIFQMNNTIRTQTIHVIGMTSFAGRLKTARSMKISRIGRNAIKKYGIVIPHINNAYSLVSA